MILKVSSHTLKLPRARPGEGAESLFRSASCLNFMFACETAHQLLGRWAAATGDYLTLDRAHNKRLLRFHGLGVFQEREPERTRVGN